MHSASDRRCGNACACLRTSTARYRERMSRSTLLLHAFALALVAGCTTDRGASTTGDRTVTKPPAQEPPPALDPNVQIADLGSCALENGEVIHGCKLAYRTFGSLAADRSNVVLWPTWFTGRTADLLPLVPDRFVDTSRFYLVLVESFGSGLSSSPSNASPAQRRLRFPRFTVRDMVESQYRLCTEHLGLDHLHAVAGISMGGMQAIQWSVSHPDFVSKVAAMVGSPQLTSQDLLLWHTMVNALDDDVAYQRGEYAGHPTLRTAVDLLNLVLFTPAYRSKTIAPGALSGFLEAAEKSSTFDWNDMHRQLEAMMAHDVAAPHGSLQDAADRVSARSLYWVSAHDLVVNPQPTEDFATLVGADLYVSQSNCGHLAVQACETDAAAATVAAFLSD